MKNNNRYSFLVCILILSMLLPGCGSKEEVVEEEKSIKVDKKQVEFTAKQVENLPIDLTNLVASSFEKVTQATGQVSVDPDKSQAISFPISGTISWLKSRLLSGNTVVKGEKLGEIYSLEAIRLQEEFQIVRIQQKRAFAEKERQAKLASADATSQKVRQEVEEMYEMNRVRLSSLQSQLMAIGLSEKELQSGQIVRKLPVRSPISGRLVQVFVQVGGKVIEREPLFQLMQTAQKRVICKLHQEDAQQVQLGQKVGFPSYPAWVGVIEQIGATTDERDQTVDVFVRVNSATEIPLNQRLQVEIKTKRKQVNTLPSTAIQTTDQGETYVWVKYKEQNRVVFKQVPVKIGETNGKFTEVISPAILTDVVMNGAIYLVTDSEE